MFKWVKENNLSDMEPLFCFTGIELGKTGSKLRDRCLTRAKENKQIKNYTRKIC